MYAQTRETGFGDEVKRRILIGTYALSAGYYDAYYLKAQKVRALIARDFKAAFDGGVDVILTPTTPSAAFGLDEEITDPVTMYLNDVFTVPTSLAGLPGLSVPVALTDAGLPQGLQLIGRPFDEETVLRAGRALEKAAAFAAKPRLLEG
jgi:aspartyl-tRNA(Asn)/glutamyl-tRNA(Gln) amidotransferase subunit A